VGDLALVCGAGGKLGSAVVETLRSRGDDVVAPSRADVDLADPDAVDAFWDGLERTPRWVVNTAGGYRRGSVADAEPDAVREALALNLDTVWWTARAAARRLEAGGAIVHVAGRTAFERGADAAAYSVAKAGVVRLTQVLALELREKRVRANVVVPGVIDTPANRASLSAQALETAVAPPEIAAAIAFLCSDDAAAVTGAVVPVAGWA